VRSLCSVLKMLLSFTIKYLCRLVSASHISIDVSKTKKKQQRDAMKCAIVLLSCLNRKMVLVKQNDRLVNIAEREHKLLAQSENY
jgi:hypothetical protein